MHASTRTLSLAGAIAAALSMTPASGQGVLEEIVVTAQKREQSLQDVSVAVTAVSGDELARNGVTDISRLDVLAPGLQLGLSGNDPRPAMRGARTEQIEANDVAISFYTDGLYRPRHGQALAGFVDINRVEVLRGPQGTLFGRNSFGGLINVIANKPTFEELDYGLSFTAGDYARKRLEGFVNVPTSDNSALRIAAVRETRDPYVENLVLGDDGGLKDADTSYVRALWSVTPSDTLDLNLRAEYWRDDSNGNASFGYKVLGIPVNPASGLTNGVTGVMEPRIGRSTACNVTCGRAGAGLDQTSTGGPNTATPIFSDPYTIARDGIPTRDIEEATLAGEMNMALAFADLKVTLAYMDYTEFRFDDTDLSPYPSLENGNDIASETTSQEIQFTSNSDGDWEWVAGVFFLQEDLENAFLWKDVSRLEDNVPVERIDQFAPWTQQIRIDTTSAAAYGQATYSLSDTWRVIGGLRYTDDKREWDIFGQDPNDLTRISFTNPTVMGAEQSWDKFTWKLGAEWDVGPSSLAYATLSTGFLAGNAQGAFSGDGFYDEQTVTAFEIGSKNTLADGTMILNASLYYNQFEDLLSTRFVDAGQTTLAFQDNAGEIDALGLEVEFDWAPTDALQLGARVALTNAEYGDFVTPNVFAEGGETINGVANLFNLDGLQVQMSPDFTVTLLGAYTYTLASGATLRPGITVYYSDDYRVADAPFFYANQDSFSKTDLSLTWESASQEWSVRAFVQNLEDEAVLLRATRFGGDVAIADFAAPRTVGATVSFRY